MSADLAISDPCVVFALRRESMYFRRDYRFQRRFPAAPCRAQFRESQVADAPRSGRTVLMLETGLGATAMETALRWCLGSPHLGEVSYRPRFVLSAGFSGALQPEQRVGDLILATEVVDQKGNCWPAANSSISRDIIAGRLLTVSELVSDPREKQRLGQQYQAIAVDMETAIAARICHEHGVPFASIRVISDDLNTTLSPHLVDLLQQGRVSPARLAWALLRHPMLIQELGRLAAQTRLAAERLRAIGDFMER
jgi:adenosylhomocysteine nucleosidase